MLTNLDADASTSFATFAVYNGRNACALSGTRIILPFPQQWHLRLGQSVHLLLLQSIELRLRQSTHLLRELVATEAAGIKCMEVLARTARRTGFLGSCTAGDVASLAAGAALTTAIEYIFDEVGLSVWTTDWDLGKSYGVYTVRRFVIHCVIPGIQMQWMVATMTGIVCTGTLETEDSFEGTKPGHNVGTE